MPRLASYHLRGILKQKSQKSLMSTEEPTKSNLTSNSQTPWFSTNELLEYLGISDAEFKQQLKLFKEGTHFKRENPSDSTSQLLWRLDLIDELLCMQVPPLEREAMRNAINNKITCNEC